MFHEKAQLNCRPSILSYQHMPYCVFVQYFTTISWWPITTRQSIFSKPPWELWFKDLSNLIVTLGSLNLDLGSLRYSWHHFRPIQIHLAHQAPLQAHLDKFGTLGTSLGPLGITLGPFRHLRPIRHHFRPIQIHLAH